MVPIIPPTPFREDTIIAAPSPYAHTPTALGAIATQAGASYSQYSLPPTTPRSVRPTRGGSRLLLVSGPMEMGVDPSSNGNHPTLGGSTASAIPVAPHPLPRSSSSIIATAMNVPLAPARSAPVPPSASPLPSQHTLAQAPIVVAGAADEERQECQAEQMGSANSSQSSDLHLSSLSLTTHSLEGLPPHTIAVITQALHQAASAGNTERLAALLRQGVSVDMTDEYNRTALIHAVHGGQAGCVRLLVNQGATLDIQSSGIYIDI